MVHFLFMLLLISLGHINLVTFRKKKNTQQKKHKTSNNKQFFKIGFFFFKNENSAPLSVITPGLGEGENELGMTIFFFSYMTLLTIFS